ncbi:KdsC family phosphatase [Peredibacter sp. HCB2-198]|uniref:HAD hydrolase family protein n=1 Tax=Peredibacter starrii TaxID=28202 RepID=A0AAX4HLX5_9BACT|nr:HAD family hydrolase [Peredibacter starrii]WPU64226.1 HAD hydrolase family protein [Peredibacter starrii]
MSLKDTSKKFEAKLKKIKVVCFDLDGILTDSHVWWASEEVGFNRTFCIYDGYGMKLLMKAGIKVGVITGGNSISVTKRTEQLGLDFCYAGNEDKREAYMDMMKKYNVTPEEVLYMGDELFDIPLLRKSGFSATVPNCSDEVKEQVDYVTIKESGKGCAREVIDLVRYAQNIHPNIGDF